MYLRLCFIIMLNGFCGCIFSQIKMPTNWEFSVQKKKKNNYQVLMKVNIEPHWHIYALKAGTGPVSTSIEFEKNPFIEIIGEPSETGKLVEKYDAAFQTTLRYYDNEYLLTQNIGLKTKVQTQLNGTITYMVCDATKCLPPTKKKFSINIK